MVNRPDVTIIGGGIAGPALALFLHKAGIRARVFEARPRGTAPGGGLQIAPNGMKVLAQIGLDEALAQHGAVSIGIRFLNERGALLSEVEHQPPSRYGQPAVNVRRATVHEILLDELRRRGIETHFGKRLSDITNVDRSPVCVFDNGTAVESSIVLGADGIRSQVRGIVLPGGAPPAYTGLVTMGGFVDAAALDPASRPCSTMLTMIFGRYGFFGYGYADKSSIMWWNAIPGPEIPSEDFAALPDGDIRTRLLQIHGDWCAPVETIIRRSNPSMYIGSIHDVPSLPTWHRGRVAIIGDAAHAVSPHSGQGASLALEDAMSLANLLGGRATTPEAAFAEFERSRRARVEKIVDYGRRSAHQKRELGTLGAWLRDRFVSLLLPRLLRKSSDWMYDHTIRWTQAGSP